MVTLIRLPLLEKKLEAGSYILANTLVVLRKISIFNWMRRLVIKEKDPSANCPIIKSKLPKRPIVPRAIVTVCVPGLIQRNISCWPCPERI